MRATRELKAARGHCQTQKTDAEKLGNLKRGKYLFSLVRVRSRNAAKGGINVRVKGMGRIKASRSREKEPRVRGQSVRRH